VTDTFLPVESLTSSSITDEICHMNIVCFKDNNDCDAMIAAMTADVTFIAKIHGEVLLQPLKQQSLMPMILTYLYVLIYAWQLTYCYDRRRRVWLCVLSFSFVLSMTKTSFSSTPPATTTFSCLLMFVVTASAIVFLLVHNTLNFDITSDAVGLAANLADVTCAATLTKYFYSQ
jgi:hypothetical protein